MKCNKNVLNHCKMYNVGISLFCILSPSRQISTGNGNSISRLSTTRGPEKEIVFPASLSHVTGKGNGTIPPEVNY